ncbi:GNAT family N-acetyltransferase [Mycoplasma sp. P36-A1]|uniref:GNAT family N-acetyltransferase n=1 Tax=Mycoplasma sp. P36-A1 TaxID=3252900 RepID=UPI003C2AD328
MEKYIEQIQLSEIDELIKMSKESYFDTFDGTCSHEDMQDYLKTAYDKTKLLKELENPNSFFYWIVVGSKKSGYIKLNIEQAQSDVFDPVALEIERLYILKEFKRHGLGKLLIDFSITKAQEFNKIFIWLGVWEHNIPALSFYSDQGFYKIGAHPFKVGDDIQTDLIYRKDL